MAVSIWEGNKAQELIDAIKDTNNSRLTEDIKAALLNCFQNVTWINTNGQMYYNNLYNALYFSPEEGWEYEWDASSESLPPGITDVVEYNFTDAPGYLTLKGGGVVKFNHVGDCEIVTELKGYSYLGDANSPVVSIAKSNGSTDDRYNGGNFRFHRYTNDKNVYTNVSGSIVSTGVDSRDDHVYDMILRNGQYVLMIDNNIVATGEGASNAILTTNGTSFFNASYCVVNVKSLKFRKL